MRGDKVPSEDHVGFHCAPSVLLTIDGDGRAVGVSPNAFRVDEDGVSVNWLEYARGAGAEPFADLCSILSRTRKVRTSHRVGMIDVVDIEAIVVPDGASPHVEHDPIDDPFNPGHSLIKGVATNDDVTLEALSVIAEVREFLPK